VIAALHQAKDAQIVRFRSAAGKNDLRRTRIQKRSHGSTRLLHSRARMLAMVVDRRCIAKLLQVERPHRLKHLRQKRGGGVVVKVDAHESRLLSFVSRGPR